ncbi:MAG: DUF2905 domain-containing protein [Deltaproteobacteria bacterium]|nr:MAG: DUF2905 domain-containing protein [Deltaproteobacteria bacterium]
MEGLGKILILFGIILVVIGLGMAFIPKIPFLGKLPGDLYIKRNNFSFYFPIVTCLLLSLILSILLSLFIRR